MGQLNVESALSSASVLAAPRWMRRKQARPTEITEAALDLFVERGFAATKLDQVAQRACISKGTLYLYFPSKEALFKAVVRDTIVPLLDEFERQLEASKNQEASSLLDRFFAEWWLQFGSTKASGICKIVVSEAGNFPEMADFFEKEVILPSHALIGKILHLGIQSGEFRKVNIEAQTHLIMAPLVMRAIWRHSLGRRHSDQIIDNQQLISVHQENMKRALAATPAGAFN